MAVGQGRGSSDGGASVLELGGSCGAQDLIMSPCAGTRARGWGVCVMSL